MFFGERAGNFRERGGGLVGLRREDQNVRRFDDFEVGRGGGGADFGGEAFARGGERVGGDDFARNDEFGVDKTLGDITGVVLRPLL